MDNILKNILNQKRISEQEGLKLLKDFSSLEIGQLANIAKKQKGIKNKFGLSHDMSRGGGISKGSKKSRLLNIDVGEI